MLVGLALLIFLFAKVPPVGANGQTDLVVVIAFVVTLMVLTSGVAAFLLLHLHRRWPALAGAKRGAPDPSVAIRQGVLTGATVGILIVLGLTQMLDIVFILVTVLVAGLIEAFLQSRS